MLKPVCGTLLLILFNVCLFAQTEPRTAPVKWERYKISGKNVSLFLPKLPVLMEWFDVCSETQSQSISVYAEDAIYGLKITSQIKNADQSRCETKRKYNDNDFKERIKALKSDKLTNVTINNLEYTKINIGDSTYWFYNDSKNKRWFEFWVVGESETQPSVKNFIESAELFEIRAGVEIGKGAKQILGDEKISVTSNAAEQNQTTAAVGGEIVGVRVVTKPRPSYTETARRNNTVGTVRLRVTFMMHGGIGAVSPITTLPDGLTERAIEAAQKIAFIPAKRNGVPVSVVKMVEYSFSLY